MNHALAFIFLISSLNLVAQSNEVSLVIEPSLNNNPIELNKKYFEESLYDSIQFETLSFYISNIRLFNNSDLVHSLEKKHHLINLEKSNSKTISISNFSLLKFNTIKFYLGIDSTTNISGAYGGDLDPTMGMYWTWQSGYVNFKLEGTSPACSTRNNVFQYHIGGYQYPHSSCQEISLSVSQQESIKIDLKLDQFFSSVDITTLSSVMSPGKEAVKISKTISSIFSINNED